LIAMNFVLDLRIAVLFAALLVGLSKLIAGLWLTAMLVIGIINVKQRRQQRRCLPILDNYKTLSEVQNALRGAGLERSDLIVGVDFTKSNLWTGERTFGGHNLHTISPNKDKMNPYQRAIAVIGRTLQVFDDDNLIPAFGFGDRNTTDQALFALSGGKAHCHGFDDVLTKYEAAAQRVVLSGPTSFVPLINKAVDIVKSTGSYHILLIIADGQVTDRQANIDAIVRASGFALSIVMVGVGDGPWDTMENFDDALPSRAFDNFQFVNMDRVLREHDGSDAAFALAALMEIPEQFKHIRELGLIGGCRTDAEGLKRSRGYAAPA